ncbi:winged helix-turn-helix domain-containing protein [Cryobacterium sp. SO2]|uniref:GntR family transcriptional regulator n=1 Tax=Cryobacterium sp. SO2 TaxID=1897060 RepID=UPI00223D763D|nr:winged helix-turn-helix domain-containing protein [Cryobacterium sp. SO2]WEO76252.1 winged helix-turn-helix domain-containing protein [Cryobacterium sp. SO2]
MINLDGSGQPADQIYQTLRSVILAGSMATGTRLAPVRQLARDLQVAPGTVAKAYKLLEQDGLVVSRAGAGTRVAAGVTAPPAAVLTAARILASVAADNGLSLDDAITALRGSWPG